MTPVLCLVDVGVADAAEQHLALNVAFAQFFPCEGEGAQRALRVMGGIAAGRDDGSSRQEVRRTLERLLGSRPVARPPPNVGIGALVRLFSGAGAARAMAASAR